MIPDKKLIRKKCRKQKIKFREGNFFKDAEELILLESLFVQETMLDSFMLLLDMLLYPIYVLVRLCMLDFSISFVFGLMKSYEMWFNYIRLEELRREFSEWIRIVKSLNGPWISTNDPEYRPYVYADAMQRINEVLKK